MEKLRTQKESKYEAAVRGRAPFTDEDVTELKDLLEGTFPYEGLQFSATSPEGYSEKYQVYRAHKSVFITREKTGESIRLYEKNIHRRLKGNEWSPPRGSEQEDLLVRTWSDVFRTALEAARKFAYVKKEWASFIDNFQGTSTQFYIEHSPFLMTIDDDRVRFKDNRDSSHPITFFSLSRDGHTIYDKDHLQGLNTDTPEGEKLLSKHSDFIANAMRAIRETRGGV